VKLRQKLKAYIVLIVASSLLASTIGPRLLGVSPSELLKIAGIILAGCGLLITVSGLLSKRRARSKLRQIVVDNLAMQVDLARHPPVPAAKTEIESAEPSQLLTPDLASNF
jgi:hypothetical protein